MRLRLAIFTIAALAGFGAMPAKAEVWYPWCAQYAGGPQGISATVCSFTTHEQCVATVRSQGGFCQQNPAPPPPDRRIRR